MSNNTKKISKQERREMAIKRAKRRKKIIIAISAILLLTLTVFITISAIQTARTQTYTDGGATVNLHPNGKFTAVLYHFEQYSGTYNKTEQDGLTIITYTYDSGHSFDGIIIDDQLHIPAEWDDGHGHGSILSLQ